ncbi:hypothetical protein [Sandaracinus amylolyticus]|uniref:Uncharacterized protein n=1 Tax=Sandaracinus amylolyticus TaxID=927083 RepID=A0A0F6SH09_9BACT|nr:hypothetical protein [Sandaracinus amylolyticus]AKF09624.1 hypothetical protein DB32_006773 [Sandaracinus amylolyticus]
MEGIEAASWMAMVGSLAATLLSLVVDVGLLLVALGPVRRHRPDVSGLLATAACILALSTLCAPVLIAIGPMISAAAGASLDSTIALTTATSFFIGLVRAAGFAMVIAGIARLASPRRHDPREPS